VHPSVGSASKSATGGCGAWQGPRQLIWLMKLLIWPMDCADQVFVLLTDGAMMVLDPWASWLALKLCPNSWAWSTRRRLPLEVKSSSTLYRTEVQDRKSTRLNSSHVKISYAV